MGAVVCSLAEFCVNFAFFLPSVYLTSTPNFSRTTWSWLPSLLFSFLHSTLFFQHNRHFQSLLWLIRSRMLFQELSWFLLKWNAFAFLFLFIKSLHVLSLPTVPMHCLLLRWRGNWAHKNKEARPKWPQFYFIRFFFGVFHQKPSFGIGAWKSSDWANCFSVISATVRWTVKMRNLFDFRFRMPFSGVPMELPYGQLSN